MHALVTGCNLKLPNGSIISLYISRDQNGVIRGKLVVSFVLKSHTVYFDCTFQRKI